MIVLEIEMVWELRDLVAWKLAENPGIGAENPEISAENWLKIG